MRHYLAATVSCGVVISGCAIGTAIVLAGIVARVITDPFARSLRGWLTPLSIVVALWVVRTVTRWLQARLGQRGASAVIADLNDQVLAAVTARQPNHLAAQRDEAAIVVTRGLDGLRPYFTGYVPTLLLAAILTPATVAVIAVYDLKSMVIVVITLPLIPIFMVLIGMATAERSAAALSAMTTLQGRLLDLIAGIPTLRALGRASGPEHRIAELAAAHRRSAMATLRIAFLSALVLELLATLGVALIAVGIGLRLVFGEMSLTIGLTVLLLAPDVYWPLRRIGVEFHAAQNGRTAADKAFALIGEPAATAVRTRTVVAHGAQIRLEALSVAGRDGNSPCELTATIQPGLVTVLTGRNGAGKTTSLQAIAGLTVPSSGRITLDGVDVTELEQTAWWRQLSWLPQRPVLLPGTVGDNLGLLGELDDIERACAAAGFDAVLAELPDGPDTAVGRDGVGLSLGQRQRLGLARALGSRAAVLLLDEPTAHLDTHTEERVLRAIVERARAGATVVVVGHRQPVLAIADQVIEVVSDGQVSHAHV
ncbi:thiol reductant ABC exporter subunit CydD [Mycobacterium montefiorense]|uniref:Thiol reductant ABC exporter subunit CydD n=1 Tax=Mycobacterium montefiorense TaxID=154654 RepID=A0AA37PJW0_9MYCO|nr:thiol reductant ABC exporter subunit CydD [Mycobacterium montefiorense]GBG38586.1 thiol reductant ABC exporter subunit CydD [Mycobacterium montefiorense]GKU34414.1 thiol reductant ABC exporter subunit CydD [Mycobacterium montefiorense]GKU39035.1 thiol reductant ABC exporter subunit CydD [Mycobacterium montefiorense]GKU47927.1 thiol reductant ABC exporter subunit CydD [Mycobacterium montefiorense]GKU49800.1 thiol reductant ABC exporter subunit CydD [Mycobacterium montefiorense]